MAMLMQVDIPKKLNKKLRMYAMKKSLGNREMATIYILNKFLKKRNER